MTSNEDGIFTCGDDKVHTTIGWKRSHHLVIVNAVIATTAIMLPYIVAVARKDMPAFLPLISQAGGQPPMTGMFGVPLFVLAFTVFFFIILLHETIKQRNTNNSKIVRIGNNLGFCAMCAASIGFIMTGAFPAGNSENRSKYDWFIDVLIGHTIGASMIYAGTAFFHFMMTLIWCWLPDATKKMKIFRIIISILYMTVFFYCGNYMRKYIADETGPKGFDIEHLKTITYHLPLVFSKSYVVCAFGEFAACFFAIIGLTTLYYDMKRVSFRATIRLKCCCEDSCDVFEI